MEYVSISEAYKDCEILIGLVYPVGTDYKMVTSKLTSKFKTFGYTLEEIRVSTEIISKTSPAPVKSSDEFDRVWKFMDLGNQMRTASDDKGIIGLGVADVICSKRQAADTGTGARALGRKVFLINSLKHPEEVRRLREIYEDGFYLIAIDEEESRRLNYLEKIGIEPEKGKQLIGFAS